MSKWTKVACMVTGMGLAMVASGGRSGVEMPDRSTLLRVRASSFRAARLAEIPRAKEFAEINLDQPDNWPRRVPLYAADHSGLTFWATQGNGPEHLEYELGNRLMEEADLAGFRLWWGPEPASRFVVSSSRDGKTWTTLHEGSGKADAREEHLFDEPVRARLLRLTLLSSANGKGFTVRRFEVLGRPDKVAPPPGVKAVVEDGAVRVSWSAAGAQAYRYCVYRSKDAGLAASLDQLGGCVDGLEFKERGLAAGTWRYLVRTESFGGSQSPSSEAVTVEAAGGAASPFAFRGVVEGFYNDPWPHRERLKVIAFLQQAGLNYYLYAPKQDPYHRQLWREPYPEEELGNFAALVSASRAHGVTFNFGISPGLDFNYGADADLDRLLAKLETLRNVGVRSFTLGMDDITGWKKASGSMAREQVKLANSLLARLRERDPAVELWFVPTVYYGTYEQWSASKSGWAAYLKELRNLDPSIRVMWTGPGTIFSERISAASAASLAKALGRKPVIWDNLPVNDISLRHHLILAPYQGRDAALAESVDGILLNPMYQPNASMVTVHTAGAFMADPAGYDPNRAYADAVKAVAGDGGEAALRALADTLAFHPLFPSQSVDRLPITRLIETFWKARENSQGLEAAEQELRLVFVAYSTNPDDLERRLENHELADELMEASNKLSLYGRAGLLALDYLKTGDRSERELIERNLTKLIKEARDLPWKVADNTLAGLYTPPGSKEGRHENVLESFLERALRER